MEVANDDDSKTDTLEFSFSNGIAKSVKTIRYFADSDEWEVFHYISDAWKNGNQLMISSIVNLLVE